MYAGHTASDPPDFTPAGPRFVDGSRALRDGWEILAAMPAPHTRRHDARTAVLYAWALLREFRLTLLLIGIAVALAAAVFLNSPQTGEPLTFGRALYAGWAALLNQSIVPPATWYLGLIGGLYPLIGLALIGEGLIRFVLLMSSRQRGEKEWMRVMASTYRDHVVLCGVGHVGYRVLQRLAESGAAVVVVEMNATGRFVGPARASGVPLLIRDMRDDTALVEAGVPHARTIVIATDDDMANLEVALDARRMNAHIRIVMRLFDQQIAAKLKSAGIVDEAFSASALAAPVIAEMALATRAHTAG